mmetsp:Transcript_35016/g.81968  ORF Transcript_35016/g.81968 Transcript_35016/m.81968 type:complete len:259 (-) Transcript_35016:26-802(-)
MGELAHAGLPQRAAARFLPLAACSGHLSDRHREGRRLHRLVWRRPPSGAVAALRRHPQEERRGHIALRGSPRDRSFDRPAGAQGAAAGAGASQGGDAPRDGLIERAQEDEERDALEAGGAAGAAACAAAGFVEYGHRQNEGSPSTQARGQSQCRSRWSSCAQEGEAMNRNCCLNAPRRAMDHAPRAGRHSSAHAALHEFWLAQMVITIKHTRAISVKVQSAPRLFYGCIGLLESSLSVIDIRGMHVLSRSEMARRSVI